MLKGRSDGFGATSGTMDADVGSLTQYTAWSITKSAVRPEPELKFDSQVKAVIKTSFFIHRGKWPKQSQFSESST